MGKSYAEPWDDPRVFSAEAIRPGGFFAQGSVKHHDMSKEKKARGKQSMEKLYETMTFSNNCKICSKHFGTKHLRSLRSMT